ncbi:MAG: rhamnogalacturonan acetylesterase [Chitinophagaceae bacterium]
MISIFLKKSALYFILVLLPFTLVEKKHIKVYLVGDSTMSKKEIKAYPETGWGMPFSIFFDSTVMVDNKAMNGRSTKSFMTENRWQPVVDSLQEGDYVFIQFGHNDEVSTKATYTTPDEFTFNLAKYVTDSRNKKAFPVLLTPVARRNFDTASHVVGTHEAYSKLVRDVAIKYEVPFIDLDKKSQEFLQSYGTEKSKLLFNWLDAGEHPNYPKGNQDNTHFNELGARKIAEIVLSAIKDMHLELAERIVKRS